MKFDTYNALHCIALYTSHIIKWHKITYITYIHILHSDIFPYIKLTYINPCICTGMQTLMHCIHYIRAAVPLHCVHEVDTLHHLSYHWSTLHASNYITWWHTKPSYSVTITYIISNTKTYKGHTLHSNIYAAVQTCKYTYINTLDWIHYTHYTDCIGYCTYKHTCKYWIRQIVLYENIYPYKINNTYTNTRSVRAIHALHRTLTMQYRQYIAIKYMHWNMRTNKNMKNVHTPI